VNLAASSCSCKDFQNIQISCRHAIAAIHKLNYAVNDFIHEAYFITIYKAIYNIFFIFIDTENLSDHSDDEVCTTQLRRGRIFKKYKHTNQSQSLQQSNSCSICKKNNHIKHSSLCTRYKSEFFFYTQSDMGVKIRESQLSLHLSLQLSLHLSLHPSILLRNTSKITQFLQRRI
jgi:hypothetical protein